jgi:3-hydroxymyristoyl/3-hydroxydecanoyl-(acyl carrier protein) dehydratase
MLASGTAILEIIPQRPPMVMVERLMVCDSKTTVTQLPVKEDNIFLTKNGLSPSGIMESMAQTAAARTGWLIKNQSGSENKKVPIGVIGSIKNFKLHFQPVAGMLMNITVEVRLEVMQAAVVNAKVEVEGKLSAEAEMQIFLTETES